MAGRQDALPLAELVGHDLGGGQGRADVLGRHVVVVVVHGRVDDEQVVVAELRLDLHGAQDQHVESPGVGGVTEHDLRLPSLRQECPVLGPHEVVDAKLGPDVLSHGCRP